MDIAYNNGWNIMTSWCYEEDIFFLFREKDIPAFYQLILGAVAEPHK